MLYKLNPFTGKLDYFQNNAATNNIIIDAAPRTIDGQSSYTLNTDSESVSLYSDGVNWFLK
jgi:hypothetical protein